MATLGFGNLILSQEAQSAPFRQHWLCCLSLYVLATARFTLTTYTNHEGCHVMERESFMSQEIADVLNASFIPVKIDREERPDIDAIYMNC